jgi:hypothetical protein
MAIRSAALAVVVAAGLGACASYEEPAPASIAPVAPAAPVVAVTPAPASTPTALATLKPGSFRAGNGILESIGLVTLPQASAAAGGGTSASAGGGTVAAPAPGPYRLTIRMDDGSIQTVIQDTRALLVGDRVQITADGRLIRP